MEAIVVLVFVLVYLGMIVGRIPGLGLDRSGLALVGAIALLAIGWFSLTEAVAAIDASTLSLLFGLMLVSAQLRIGGFYSAVTERMARVDVSPPALLGLMVVSAGILSALLVNDIAVLAMAPLLIEICVRRSLDPMPFLLGLAAAANVGSAGTLIGNPQNALIGQTLDLSFARYLADGGVPAALGLGIVWLVIAWAYRGKWTKASPPLAVERPPFDRWHTIRGLVVLAALIALFLVGRWPRELLALVAGGALLVFNRGIDSRRILNLVDWQLLVLFAGLFVVNAALLATSAFGQTTDTLAGRGVDMSNPAVLFASSAVLSNIVSNVPAVMLLLPFAKGEIAGPALALASTFAGNFLIVGSIANIIMVDQAGRLGFRITWRDHARIGVPVTLLTLFLAAGWLWLRAP
ncbi:MAG: anion transporter [SAR202 cluster bacterium]|nr:anion transporter [SAR202 cluster bacterium]